MKNKKEKQKIAAIPLRNGGISKRGRKVIIAGALILAAGFFVLTKTDPAGQNMASIVSPFLILCGYVMIGSGILIPERPLVDEKADRKGIVS